MGLFDFLKKLNSVQPPTDVKQNVTKSQSFTYEAPKPAYVKKEVVAKTSAVEISIEQDGPPLLGDLVKNAIPSKQGLYPHEIMMLEYAPSFKTSGNSFQSFWYYQYSVTDPQSILDSLFNRGFIEVGDLRSALEKLKLPEIKEELKFLEQKLTGKKDELIDRLLENGNLASLNEKYRERYFALTSKGEQELKENQYVSYLHRHRYMTVWEMNQRIAQTHYPYRDILWGYFNEQSGVHFQEGNYGLYRNTRLHMHDFLLEEDKFKTALHLLIEVISFDLSGLGNSTKLLSANDIGKEIYCESRLSNFFDEEDEVTLPPAIIKYFDELKAKLNLADDEFISYIYKEFSEINIHDRVFSAEECANIILSEIGMEERKIKSSYKVAEQRLKKSVGLK